MSPKPLCFIVMPFGSKPDPTRRQNIDFDRIYDLSIKPGVEAAGMEPIRADEELTGGIIHKPMYERLLLCDYVLADLTTGNPNVFYELGIRHAVRRHTTMTIFAKHQPIPFDINFLRSLPYDLGKNNNFKDELAQTLRQAISARLQELRQQAVEEASVDSPLFQLLSGWEPKFDIARLKTDVFREKVKLNKDFKQQLATIRTKAKKATHRDEANHQLLEFRQQLGELDSIEAGTLVDYFLSLRALKNWDGMIAFYEEMPEVLKRQILVREQLGFAYNRRATTNQDPSDRDQALRILTEVEEQQGPSSETCGLMGRIHKDNWAEALEHGETFAASGHLQAGIEAYSRGFLADPRDSYPGINAVTLLEIKGDSKSLEEKERLLPVVKFAVERRLDDKPDYWDYATMLELAVLENDKKSANERLGQSLAAMREPWEAETTANNLMMIARSRQHRKVDISWLEEIIEQLKTKGQ